MKKIMFNDKYGLTNAVLEGKKTMTRRTVTHNLFNQTDWKAISEGDYEAVVDGEGEYHDIRYCGRYQVGEVVAIAQSYRDIEKEIIRLGLPLDMKEEYQKEKGWNNKMFVKASLMPHHIRITNIKVEQLQDISDEDCIREGIYACSDESVTGIKCNGFLYSKDSACERCSMTPKKAFATLIDKVSGKGTWDKNPYVFVYEFELID